MLRNDFAFQRPRLRVALPLLRSLVNALLRRCPPIMIALDVHPRMDSSSDFLDEERTDLELDAMGGESGERTRINTRTTSRRFEYCRVKNCKRVILQL